MIRSSNGRIQVEGQDPHDIESTVELVHNVMRLPPASLNPNDRTISWFLGAIVPSALTRFVKLIELGDDATRKHFQQLQTEFCGIAEPGAHSWQVPTPDNVVEELPVQAGCVLGATFLMDGSMLLGVVLPNNVQRLVTSAEFQLYFRTTVRRYCIEFAQMQAAALKRLCQLAEAAPARYELSYSDSDLRIGTKTFAVRSKDQLANWCAARALKPMSIEVSNAV